MLAKLRAKLKGWKTVAWNSVVAVSGILLVLADQLQTVDWSRVFTPTVCGMIVVGLSVAAILLRLVTTTAIGAK